MTQTRTLQQEIQEAEAKLNELRKKFDEERKGERMQAITTARELIKTHTLTAVDLGFTGKASVGKSSTGDKRNVVAPKYQDPENGKTWTGRGKTPAWLSAHIEAGRNREEFLIKNWNYLIRLSADKEVWPKIQVSLFWRRKVFLVNWIQLGHGKKPAAIEQSIRNLS